MSLSTMQSHFAGEDLPGGDHRSLCDSVDSDGSMAERRSKACRVCGDKALSINFNVITCESCKAFFRRNALKPKAFRCPFNGSCEINVVSRKFCKKCRLRKCFEVGMMKEWIMSDEARIKKRELINTNRERRRAIIMATAAKHVAQERVQHLTGAAFQHAELLPHGSDHSVSSSLPESYNPLLTLRKSELIGILLQCGCSYEGRMERIVEEFVEHHTVQNHPDTSSDGQSQCPPLLSQRELEIPFRPTKHNAEPTDSGHILSFLAPRVGKRQQAVGGPMMDCESVTPVPHNEPISGSCWLTRSSTMPTVALDPLSCAYDLSVPFHQTRLLSCPLPVRLTSNQDEPPCPARRDHTLDSLHENCTPAKGKEKVMPGILDQLPFTMVPVMLELLEAKKHLQIDKSNTQNGQETDRKANSTVRLADFFKAVSAFANLSIHDQTALLAGNLRELHTLCQSLMSCGDSANQNVTVDGNGRHSSKHDHFVPKKWLKDECIVLILMAISVFDTERCPQLKCKQVAHGRQQFYIDFLLKYLDFVSGTLDALPLTAKVQ